MGEIFIQILDISYQASIVICFILIARKLLSFLKIPKRYAYLLWSIPFIRMICPFSFKSIFSMLPKNSSPMRSDYAYLLTPKINTGTVNGEVVSKAVNYNTSTVSVERADLLKVCITVFQWVWLLGIVTLVIYSVISFIRLRRKLTGSVILEGNVYLADHIESPFVLGIVKPRIYLPSGIQEDEMYYVLSHERAHIRRKDYLIKLVAFLIICVHWFNPLVWVAFTYFCKDMEMSCDEAVMKLYGESSRKAYATTLLTISAGRSIAIGKSGITGIPLAFGEGDTKGRIKNIMNYRKPRFIVMAVAVIIVIGLAIGLLTNPNSSVADEKDNLARKDSSGQDIEKSNEEDIDKMGTVDPITTDPTSADPKSISEGIEESISGTEPEVITITPPTLDMSTSLGTDGAMLDYAGNRIVIFHGYFGLFVYSIEESRMIGAVDLISIGCQYTQGDSYCDVNVSADGKTVYLHPMNEKHMYVYEVMEQELYKTDYSLEGIELFGQYADISINDDAGYRSYWGVEFNVDGRKYYGYVDSSDWTIGTLMYIEDDMIVNLFETYFQATSIDQLDSRLYGMTVIPPKLLNVGGTFKIFNNSTQTIEYGESYKLQKKENGSWIDVPYVIDNWGFHDIAYSIPAKESKEFNVDWEWLYGKLPDGDYFFIKEMYVKNSDSSFEKYPLSVEFQITADSDATKGNVGYSQALTEEELAYVKKLAKTYYEKEFSYDLLSIAVASDDDQLYSNYPEYEPGNIIIFLSETTHAGEGVYRSIVFGREDKNSKWERVNEGY